VLGRDRGGDQRLDRARGALAAAGFVVRFAGAGGPGTTAEAQWQVTAQDPKAGRSRPVGTVVRLRITRL
jgi:beta-lactam-binding protein with PASTA domain